MTVHLLTGDCCEVLRALPADSVDSCVTDPPYHLHSIVRRFGKEGSAPAKVGATGAYARASAGFMGQAWDGGGVAFDPATWAEVFRVLKPGAHLAAFGGTRTVHRLACAIEDAGFEIRDRVPHYHGSGDPWAQFVASLDGEQRAALSRILDDASPSGLLDWVYGSGFPKSHQVCRPVDDLVVGERCDDDELARGPVSHTAALVEGFGTALKPACEPIVLARKPLAEASIARQVLATGTGALNIDGCRVGGAGRRDTAFGHDIRGGNYIGGVTGGLECGPQESAPAGRWPANVVHDGSAEVVALFPDAPGAQGTVAGDEPAPSTGDIFGQFAQRAPPVPRGDSGSAARFFYAAKATTAERRGSRHPTVKPVALMQWLVRLITPRGGTVLDPFAGTGTTGEAAGRENLSAILIEQSPAYVADARRRLHAAGGLLTDLREALP